MLQSSMRRQNYLSIKQQVLVSILPTAFYRQQCATQELEPEAIMGGCSQETLGLLSRGAASRPPAQPVAQRSRLGLFGGELTNMPAGGVGPLLTESLSSLSLQLLLLSR